MNILATVDITKYNSLKDLYEQLLSLKKDVFQDDERIVLIYKTDSQRQLLDELLYEIDIPEFFVDYRVTDNDSGIDFNFSNSFCIYPWINLRISAVGDISPCCMFIESFGNINKDSIQDLYHSEFMKNLRQSFLKGERPTQCTKCWREEAVGKPSMRQRAKYKFRDVYYRLDYQTDSFENLQLFDLNLGNSCNLSCRICNKEYSSTIAEKEYAEGKISAVELMDLKKSVRWAESDQFWNQMLDSVQNLKYLDLYGGEPLMSKMHFNFLKKLIALDVAKNIKIDYNTNGTVFSEKFFELWQHFKEIKLSFSIDDIESRFESQRVGAKWENVCDNIKKFNSLRSEKFITEVYPTINTQNVLYIPELISWINTQQFDSMSFNILHAPKQYNILSLDTQDKIAVIEKLKNYSHYDICSSIITLLTESIDITKEYRQINIIKV
jgi:radical SAM protein with 4Fe4S-binding SPASM domain